MAQSTPSVARAFVILFWKAESCKCPREGGGGGGVGLVKGMLGIDWAIRIGRPQVFGSNLAWWTRNLFESAKKITVTDLMNLKFVQGKWNSGTKFTSPEFCVPLTQTEFRLEKPDYLFRCFVAPGIFLGNHPKKSCFIYFPTRFSRNVLQTVNNQLPTKDQNSYKKGGGCHRMLSFSSLNFR